MLRVAERPLSHQNICLRRSPCPSSLRSPTIAVPAEQIARTHLKITGKLGEPRSLRDQLAVGVAASVADEITRHLVSPQKLRL